MEKKRNKNKYGIYISTMYGTLFVDDVYAVNSDEAFTKACDIIEKEIVNNAKLEEIIEYENRK